LAYDLIKCCVDNTNQEITAKIRIGYSADNINAVKIAKLIEKAGAKQSQYMAEQEICFTQAKLI